MRTLLLLWLSGLCCFGQGFDFRSVAFVNSANHAQAGAALETYPTNISGYPAYTWYPVEGNYDTSTKRLTNLVDVSAGLDLTNNDSTYAPTLGSDLLNGKDALLFSSINAQYLRNLAYTSSQPHEVWMVFSPSNMSASRFLFDGASLNNSTHTYRQEVNLAATDKIIMFTAGGSDVSSANNTISSNRWYIMQAVFNGANSKILTNNAQILSGNPGSATISGLTIGTRFSTNFNFVGAIAEIATYQTNLSADASLQLYQYFTNKYGIQ